MLLGEYGVVSRFNVANHEESRIRWNQYITESAVAHGMVTTYWDNGYTGDGGMGLFDRNNGNQVYPAIIDVLVGAAN